MTIRKSGLGKNLNVLLGSSKPSVDKKLNQTTLPIRQLQPGKYQPRNDFSDASLQELSASIKHQGIIQPIVVRSLADSQFEIIAGERRWRAAQLAGLEEVPVVVKKVDDQTSLAMAIVENIQREDLNPMDEARGLTKLVQEFELTHQQAAEVVGKSRASVSNLLRLMNLHTKVQLLLERGDIEMGHARALLSLSPEDQLMLATQIVEKGLSVRETELLVRKIAQPSKDVVRQQAQPELILRQKRLSELLGSKVKIKSSASGQFKLEIECKTIENIDALLDRL